MKDLFKSLTKGPVTATHFQIIITVSTLLLTITALPKLPSEIPLWYTHKWGLAQLSKPQYLLIIPLLSLSFLIINKNLIKREEKRREFEIIKLTEIATTLVLLILLLANIRIIYVTTNIIKTINYDLVALIPPLFVSFVISFIATPYVAKIMKRFGVLDDPKKHNHPAMLLTKPTPRGGAVVFLLSLIFSSIIFLTLTKKIVGILLGAAAATIIGVIEDKFDIKSARIKFFLLLPLPVLFIVGSGVGIPFFNNPFGGIVRLDTIDITIRFIGEHHLLLLADLFSFFMLIWIMGILGLSDGVDGQFSGIIAISSITIAILALRFVSFDPQQWDVAKLGAITAGASLGILRLNWHPARILWGTGDWAASLVLGSLGILSGAKVATAILVLLVPSLDAIVTIGRRIIQKSSPFEGDRGHFHHRLLDMGWGQKNIAVFYWLLTLLLSIFALYSSGKTKLLSILTLSGLIGFALVLVNLKGESKKLKELKSGLKSPKKNRHGPDYDSERNT